MKHLGQIAVWLVTVGAVLLRTSGAAPEEPAKAPTWEPPVPQSVFVDDPSAGKDPFFPESTRRAVKDELASDPNAEAHSSKSISDRLTLKGAIKGRVALINNVDFVVGQESEVNTAAGRVRVRCLQIQEDCVIVQVQGNPQPKVLRLAD